MIRLKRPQLPLQSDTQNSVERPQNRHLKPFKSRGELGGKLDPRIDAGGRPKIIGQTLPAKVQPHGLLPQPPNQTKSQIAPLT
jgi:hypothetical protein